jgi:hypothetical protein
LKITNFARESSGLSEKIVALRKAACLAGRRAVVVDSFMVISSEFQQMCSNSIHAVMINQARVGFEIRLADQ